MCERVKQRNAFPERVLLREPRSERLGVRDAIDVVDRFAISECVIFGEPLFERLCAHNTVDVCVRLRESLVVKSRERELDGATIN